MRREVDYGEPITRRPRSIGSHLPPTLIWEIDSRWHSLAAQYRFQDHLLVFSQIIAMGLAERFTPSDHISTHLRCISILDTYEMTIDHNATMKNIGAPVIETPRKTMRSTVLLNNLRQPLRPRFVLPHNNRGCMFPARRHPILRKMKGKHQTSTKRVATTQAGTPPLVLLKPQLATGMEERHL